MTTAEEIYNRKNTDDNFDAYEYIEANYQLAGSLTAWHRTTSDDGDIVEFNDGSFYSFDKRICGGDEEPWFATKADLMESLSETNEAPWDGDGDLEITGIVSGDSAYINCLTLTETTKSGEPEYWDTDDRNDYQVQEVLVEYTTELAKLVGQQVTLLAAEGFFNEERTGTAGGSYHVSRSVLTDFKIGAANSLAMEVPGGIKLVGENPRQ